MDDLSHDDAPTPHSPEREGYSNHEVRSSKKRTYWRIVLGLFLFASVLSGVWLDREIYPHVAFDIPHRTQYAISLISLNGRRRDTDQFYRDTANDVALRRRGTDPTLVTYERLDGSAYYSLSFELASDIQEVHLDDVIVLPSAPAAIKISADSGGSLTSTAPLPGFETMSMPWCYDTTETTETPFNTFLGKLLPPGSVTMAGPDPLAAGLKFAVNARALGKPRIGRRKLLCFISGSPDRVGEEDFGIAARNGDAVPYNISIQVHGATNTTFEGDYITKDGDALAYVPAVRTAVIKWTDEDIHSKREFELLLLGVVIAFFVTVVFEISREVIDSISSDTRLAPGGSSVT